MTIATRTESGVFSRGSLVFCCCVVEMNKTLLILMTVSNGTLAGPDNSPSGVNLRSLPVIPALACAARRKPGMSRHNNQAGEAC